MKIYLAIPYTGMESESFAEVNRVAGVLIRGGHIVYSPISHTHPIATECDLPGGWGFWQKFGISFIQWCDEMWVCDFGDWKTSNGICAEIEIANELGKPIRFIND